MHVSTQTAKQKALTKRISELKDLVLQAQDSADLDALEDLVHEIDQTTEELEVERARADPNAFIEYCFKDKHGNSVEQAPFHVAWQESIYHPTYSPDGNRRQMIIAPRDHGKTTQIPVGRALWELGTNPNLRIKIVCQSDSKAMERLFEIVDNMERNPAVTRVFPHLRPAERGDWCVPLDCETRLSNGHKVLIDEIRNGMRVFGWSRRDQKILAAEVEFVSEIILKPCVQVTTETGRRFRASIDHGMLSMGQDYIRAEDLKPGDPVALGRNYLVAPEGQVATHPPEEPCGVSAYEARLLGYLVGDGYTATKAGGPWFTNGNQSVFEDFRNCVLAMSWAVTEYADRGTYKMWGIIRSGSATDPREWLDEHSLLGKKSGDKRIPEKIRRSHGALLEFLATYFACDGCLDESVNRVSFTTKSEQLARDVQEAMLLIGAGGHLTPDRCTGTWKISSAGWSAIQFAKAIPDLEIDKIRYLKRWAKEYEALHDESLRRSDLWHEPGSAWNGGEWRRRKSSDPATLSWERVKTVEDIGVLPCRDITVAQPVDTFLLDDGFVAHNTKHKIVVERDLFSKDASIEAVGIMSTATGGRCDLLIADDVVDRRNSIMYPQLRESIKHGWKSDWTNLLEPDGRIVVICTLWHTADLSHEILNNPAYGVLFYGVAENLESLDMMTIAPGKGRERIYDTEPLWSHWSKADLEDRLEEIGTIEFNRGFRNIALSGEIIVVDPIWVKYFEPESLPDELLILQGFDLAISKKSHADWFAAVTVGIDLIEAMIYVLDAWHARLSFIAQGRVMVGEFLRFDPDEQHVEVVSYQDSLPQFLDSLIGKPIDNLLEDMDPVDLGLEQVRRIPALPIVRHTPRHDKMARLKAVTPYLERGRVLFNPRLDPLAGHSVKERGDLVTELTQFPLARWDDLVDALVTVLRGAGKIIALAQASEEDQDDGEELECTVQMVG